MMEYMKNNGSYHPLPSSEDFDSNSAPDDGSAIADITKLGSDCLAKQITLIELSFFKAIKREEFSSLKWNGKEKHNYAPNIVSSTRWFNQINFWVQKEILKYSYISKRAELLSFFIKVAKRLVDHNNLYSAMSIMSALQVECVYRLRHTWDGLNSKDRVAYRRLEELFSQDDNCRRQREHMNSISLPGIPYLGLYLSDLTYTNVAHPRVGGKPTTVWISKINNIIDVIAYFQKSEYPFVVDETINAYLCAQRYIEELQKFIEEDNYKTSLQLEPPPQIPPEPHQSGQVYLPPKEKESNVTGFLKLPNEPSSGRNFRSAPRTNNQLSVSSPKSASINSSFESDFVSVSESRPHKLNIDPAELNFGSSSAVISTPISRTKKKYSEPNTGVFSLQPKDLFSTAEVDEDTESTTLKPHVSASGVSPTSSNSRSNVFGYKTSTGLSPTKSTDEPSKFRPVQCPHNRLPPIPPRPSLSEPGSSSTAETPHSFLGKVVPDESGVKMQVQHSPVRLDNFLTPERSAVVHPANSTRHAFKSSSIRSISVSSESLAPKSWGSSSISHIHTPAVRRASVGGGRVEQTTDSMNAAAVAVCAAVVAKDFMGMQLSNGISAEEIHSEDITTQYNNNNNTVQPSTSSKSPSTSCPSTVPPMYYHILESDQFAVHIICQGVMQRRTMSQPRSHLNSLAALLSPKLRKNSTNVYDSTSSLSTSSAVTGSLSSLAHARPAGFSTWRRLWATLVLVGSGSAAFVIYFEPKCKNALLRSEFQAHHCQIQSLLNLHTNQELTDEYTNHDLTEDCEEAAGEFEGSELLSFKGASSESKSSTLSDKCAKKRSVSNTNPCLFNTSASVDYGRHRDGTVDPCSFLLSDPTHGKAYRFRPIVPANPSATFPRAHRPLDWLRRSGPLSPRVAPRETQSSAPNPNHLPPINYGFHSLGRPRGSSVPNNLTSSVVYPSNPRSATLRPSQTPMKNQLPTTTEIVVTEWMRSIQAVLAQLEQFQRLQFIRYHAYQHFRKHDI